MWSNTKHPPILEYLFWTFLIVLASDGAIILGEQMGWLTGTIGWVLFQAVSTLIGTFSPMYGIIIILYKHKKIQTAKDFFRLICTSPAQKKTVIIMVATCLLYLIAAMICGVRTDFPWIILLPAIPLMVIGGGVEEIGWRGFLQPALERKFAFTLSTLIVAVIWFLWHVPLWFMQNSNQSTMNMGAFILYLAVLAFVLAAVYRLTKSVAACIVIHAFGNALGAVYDWRALFASLPTSPVMVVFYAVMVISALVIGYKTRKR